jgi:hypothetical protein
VGFSCTGCKFHNLDKILFVAVVVQTEPPSSLRSIPSHACCRVGRGAERYVASTFAANHERTTVTTILAELSNPHNQLARLLRMILFLPSLIKCRLVLRNERRVLMSLYPYLHLTDQIRDMGFHVWPPSHNWTCLSLDVISSLFELYLRCFYFSSW